MKNKKQKQAMLVFLFLAVVAGGLFGMHGTAHAGLWTVAADGLELVFKALLYAIFVVFGWLLSVAVTIFGWAVDPQYVSGPTGFLNRQSIYDLWKFIRDFFNIFFIIVLLYTAFTIVFQVAKDYKKTLLHLVIMALLVNFSFPISRFLIDVANVPMYFFLNQTFTGSNSKEAFGTVLGASKIESILLTGQESGKAGFSAAKTLELPHLISAVIFMFLFSISLLVLAVMFVIRLVALVILVIFSSVGFAASILPGFNKYASQWWDMFLKYAFFGPAAALMLLITVRFLAEVGHDTTFRNVQNVAMGAAAVGNQNFIASMAFFSIPIILLWFTIGMAQSFSIAGAGAVVGWGRGIAKRAGKMTVGGIWGGTKFVARKAEKNFLAGTRVGRYFSPTAWTQAWKQRSEEKHHEDQQVFDRAAGRMHDVLNDRISRLTHNYGFLKPQAWFRRGADQSDKEFEAQQANVAKRRKEKESVSTEASYMLDELKGALGRGKEGQADVEAVMQSLMRENNVNDLLADAMNNDHELAKLIGTEGLVKDAKGNIVMSSENTKEVFMRALEKTGGQRGSEMMAKQMMVATAMGVAAGNVGLAGSAGYNPEKGKFEVFDERDQAKIAAAKFNNLEGQRRQILLHPNAVFVEGADGKGDINGEVGLSIFNTFTEVDVKQSERSRNDMKQAIYSGYKRFVEGGEKVMDKDGNLVESHYAKLYRENEIFKKYVDTIRKYIEGADKDKKKESGGGSPPVGGTGPGAVGSYSSGGIAIPPGSRTT